MRITTSLLALAITTTTFSVASAESYKAYVWYESVSVSPRKIIINAYQADDSAIVVPTKATAMLSFQQDAELFTGTTLDARFGLGFDPDNLTLATLTNAIPNASVNVNVNGQSFYSENTVQSPINLPPAMQHFKGWCTAVGANYSIDGYIWVNFPNLMSSQHGGTVGASSPVTVQVNCMDKKFAQKVDLSKLPSRLITPKLNIKIAPTIKR